MAASGRLIEPLTSKLYGAVYRHYFEVIAADTPELLDTVYRLRYQVYAIENEFEKSSDFPDREEHDGYDAHSLHVLLRHRRTKICIGTARAILPKDGDPLNSFPIQRISDHPILKDRQVAMYATEFSRLALSKEYLKQSCDATGAMARFHFDPTCTKKRINMWLTKPIMPYLAVGLMAGVAKLAAQTGHPIMFAVMERSLIRNLRRIGWDFPYIDASVDHHGLRHPCGIPSLYDAFATMKTVNATSWQIITQGGRTQQLALQAETKSASARSAVCTAKALANRIVGPPFTAPLTATHVKNSASYSRFWQLRRTRRRDLAFDPR